MYCTFKSFFQLFYLFSYILLIFKHKYKDPSIRNLNKHLETRCAIQDTNFPSRIHEKTGIASNSDLMNLMVIVNSTLLRTNTPYFLCYRTLMDVLRMKQDYQGRHIIDLCIHQTVSLLYKI